MLSTAVNQHCPVLCLWAVEQTQTHHAIVYMRAFMYERLLCHDWIHRTQFVDPWDRGGSQWSTRYDTQTYAVVSPVAAQLIQALTNISSSPALLDPHPRGSYSVTGHSHPRLWAGSQQLGLRPRGRMKGQRRKSERRKEKRWMWRGKGKRKRWGGGL